MANDPSDKMISRYIRQFHIGAIGLFSISSILLIGSFVIPIHVSNDEWKKAAVKKIVPLPEVGQNLQPLLVKMAGWRLIKPAQVQAAVKDNGLAQTLLKKLKLQGVIQVGSTLTAYIDVEKQGTQTVKQGEKILDFIVQRIEPGAVTLSLEGVEVTLGH
jgi:hypothetical protein